MSINLPMPKINHDLRGGLQTGASLFQSLIAPQLQQAQMAQQWQQHLNNLEIQRQQQERLAEQFELQKELHPYKMEAAKQGALNAQMQGPAKYELLKAQIEASKALAEQRRTGKTQDPLKQQRTQQLINSHQWSSSPSSVKDAMVAYANGIGIRPDEAVAGFTSGKTLEQMAAEKGMNPEEVSASKAKYLATNQNIRMENERQKNLAELNVIEEHVVDAMAPYISTFAGFSPKQIVDSFKGKNQDDLAKYLAARALQPEISSLRIKVMGGQVGHGAINEIVHSALGNSRIFQGQVTPEVYKKMNHYISDWLKEGSKAATESIYGRGGQTSSKNVPRKRFNINTGEVE